LHQRCRRQVAVPAKVIAEVPRDWLDFTAAARSQFSNPQLNLLYLLGDRVGWGVTTKTAILRTRRRPLMTFQNRLQEIEGVIDRRNRDRPFMITLNLPIFRQSITFDVPNSIILQLCKIH